MTTLDPDAEHIAFHMEQGDPLPDQSRLRQWISQTVQHEGRTHGRIAFNFVSDETLLKLNQRHLQHDTYTDILTFPYRESPIEAEIYISIDRVKENAIERNVDPQEELLRVMIHGVLHMCGYSDNTNEEKSMMRSKEDECLKRWLAAR